MIWFHIGLQVSGSGSIASAIEQRNISTIFTRHILGHLVVRMSRKHNEHWVGTIDRRGYGGQQKGTIIICDPYGLVSYMDRVSRIGAHKSQFFSEFDWFVVLTSRLDAYISRYGDFYATTTMTRPIPCACARVIIRGHFQTEKLTSCKSTLHAARGVCALYKALVSHQRACAVRLR